MEGQFAKQVVFEWSDLAWLVLRANEGSGGD